MSQSGWLLSDLFVKSRILPWGLGFPFIMQFCLTPLRIGLGFRKFWNKSLPANHLCVMHKLLGACTAVAVIQFNSFIDWVVGLRLIALLVFDLVQLRIGLVGWWMSKWKCQMVLFEQECSIPRMAWLCCAVQWPKTNILGTCISGKNQWMLLQVISFWSQGSTLSDCQWQNNVFDDHDDPCGHCVSELCGACKKHACMLFLKAKKSVMWMLDSSKWGVKIRGIL